MAKAPPENPYFAIFCGVVDQAAASRIGSSIGTAMAHGFNHFHLMMHSGGGSVPDGVYLHNLFRHLGIKLTVYNGGTIASAAAVAFLGAEARKSSANATFMLHRCTAPPQLASARRLERLAHSAKLDDVRLEEIIRAKCALSDDQWATHAIDDLWLSAQDAIAAGIVDEIADFKPPRGCVVTYI